MLPLLSSLQLAKALIFEEISGLHPMNTKSIPGRIRLNRRDFLTTSLFVGGGLILSVNFPNKCIGEISSAEEIINPGAYLNIAPDNSVTLIVPSSEMGQGVSTALPMILAEELDVAWEDVIVAQAPVDQVYRNPSINAQGTWGSNSVQGFYEPLRLTGARARDMLIRAAASHWGVAVESLDTDRGQVVHHQTGKRIQYGEIAAQAATLVPLAKPKLKKASDFRLIGTRAASKDTVSKVDGSAVFGIDVQLPGMLYGAVRQSPVFDCKVSQYHEQQALLMPGVHAVVEVFNGLVVVADTYWQASKALNALEITFEESPNAAVNSRQISTRLHQALLQDGDVIRHSGDPEGAFAQADSVIESVYETPLLAHATMEPMNSTASVTDEQCTLWVGVQTPEFVRYGVADLLGLKLDRVTLNMTYLGGGFGGRGRNDFVFHSVLASKAVRRPVKVIWSREEDMQQDQYRQAATARLKAALGVGGQLLAIDSRIAMCPIPMLTDPAWDCLGIIDHVYAIPNASVEYVATEYPVPVGAWRSTSYSNNTFALESFIDEIAVAADKDPFQFRQTLLQAAPRALHTLNLVADKAGWNLPMPVGYAKGIACIHQHGAYAALVVEISLKNGLPAVQRIVCATDCGVIINPRILEAQIQGCIHDGLWSSLHAKITIQKGRVQQHNFDNYPLLRLGEMPDVEVYLVTNDAPPAGAGELATPLVAPAIANALFVLTGQRIRKLPFSDHPIRDSHLA